MHGSARWMQCSMAMSRRRWAAIMVTARNSGLGHGLLHAVSAHLSHLMPPPLRPAAPAAADSAPPTPRPKSGRLRQQHGRSAHSTSSASGGKHESGSKPATPASCAGSAENAPAEEGAAVADVPRAVDALAVVPDPLASLKGKGSKKGQKYEVGFLATLLLEESHVWFARSCSGSLHECSAVSRYERGRPVNLPAESACCQACMPR